MQKLPQQGSRASGGSVQSRHYSLIDTWTKFKEFVELLNNAYKFAFDLESTSKRPLDAILVGMSFSWHENEAYYIPVLGPDGPVWEEDTQGILEKLRPILENPLVGKIGQNIKYDLLVLRRYDVALKGVTFDTMFAAYLLDPGKRRYKLDDLAMDYIGQRKLSIGALIGEKNKVQGTMDMAPIEDVCRYACTDADLTWKLEQVLAPKLVAAGLDTLMTTVEIPLMHVLADMEWQGVKVDLNKMRALSDELGKRLQELEKEAYTTYDVLNINSPTQVGKYLYDKLGMPPDPDFGYTTKADVLADLNLSTPHPFLDLMLEHRGLKKLKSTYLDGMPRMVSKRTGRIHTSFNQMITATGRLSSSEPNLQNIPMRSERGRMIRAMFIPTTYDTIMTADYSQIELRLLADQSDDTALIRAFESGEDIHAFVAAEVYGVKLADVTKEMRMKAKTVNFGIVYGMSYKALAKRIGVTPREAQSFIQDYFKRYRRVKQWMEEIISAARKNGYVLTILGRRRDVSAEIRASDRGTAGSGERKAVNTVIQGSAADLIKVAMNKVHSSLIIKQARLLLQVHDELVIELPSSEIKDVRSIVEYDMVNAMKLKVPVTVNIETGPNWLEAK